MHDIQPLIALITSTVARGTWAIHDDHGKDITSEYRLKGGGKAGDPSRPTGEITPFFLSVSLIIRCTPEVHEEVANLLRGLRRLQEARDNPGVAYEEEEEKLGIPPHQIDPKPIAPPVAGKKTRIERLLDQLRQEVEKLPNDHD